MKELDLLLKNIKNKELQPVYFFHGEEPYFMDAAVKCLEEEVLEQQDRAFGQTIVYGKDTSLAEVLSLAQQFPMMGPYNLIIVKEAQDLRWAEAESTQFEQYLNQPVLTTILVFAHKYKKLDARKKFTKKLSASKWLHYSEPVKDYQLAQWIEGYLRKQNLKADPKVAPLLAEYLGNDLSRIVNELDKLKMILGEKTLDLKAVETYIGISKDYNVFELQRALGEKNLDRAMQIAFYVGRNTKSNPMVLTVGTLCNFFSGLIIFHTMRGSSREEMASAMGISPFFLKDYERAAAFYPLKTATKIISILRETDMKVKGLGAGSTTDEELLKEMVYKILHADRLKIST